jgi:hypothetical protein
MFEKFKKRSQQQEIIKTQIAAEPEQEKIEKIPKEPQINNKPETPTIAKEPEKEIIKELKIEEKPGITHSKNISIKGTDSEFMAIKDYSSFSQLTEMINREISQSKSKLGEYLLQIDKKKTIAEKSRKIRAAVYKLTEKKQNNEAQGEFEINGLQIVLNATPRHEIEALESVVKSQQDRLQFLQNTKTSLKEFDQLGEIQGINFFVVERYGVPERILLTVP